jgi:fructokinase
VAVVDTIGAGDTFTAGLLHALLDLVPAGTDAWQGVAALDDVAWREALRTAATAAGITCTRAGCHPPTADELAQALTGPAPR